MDGAQSAARSLVLDHSSRLWLSVYAINHVFSFQYQHQAGTWALVPTAIACAHTSNNFPVVFLASKSRCACCASFKE
jgi:hypothetical protein